jgi:hypothetical protein
MRLSQRKHKPQNNACSPFTGWNGFTDSFFPNGKRPKSLLRTLEELLRTASPHEAVTITEIRSDPSSPRPDLCRFSKALRRTLYCAMTAMGSPASDDLPATVTKGLQSWRRFSRVETIGHLSPLACGAASNGWEARTGDRAWLSLS